MTRVWSGCPRRGCPAEKAGRRAGRRAGIRAGIRADARQGPPSGQTKGWRQSEGGHRLTLLSSRLRAARVIIGARPEDIGFGKRLRPGMPQAKQTIGQMSGKTGKGGAGKTKAAARVAAKVAAATKAARLAAARVVAARQAASFTVAAKLAAAWVPARVAASTARPHFRRSSPSPMRVGCRRRSSQLYQPPLLAIRPMARPSQTKQAPKLMGCRRRSNQVLGLRPGLMLRQGLRPGLTRRGRLSA